MLLTFTFDHHSQLFICSSKDYHLSALGKTIQESRDNLLMLIQEYKDNNLSAIKSVFSNK